ncbi:hypothetical protein D3C71_1916080 [compost metagenome]
MGLGRQLAQRAGLPLADGLPGGDDGIVQLQRVAQLEGAEGRQHLRPGLFVQAGGHQADADATAFQLQEKLL